MSHGAPITNAVDLQLPPVEAGPRNRRIGLVAVTAMFGGLLLGYDTGVFNGALSFMTDHFSVNPTQEELIPFAVLIGAATGAGVLLSPSILALWVANAIVFSALPPLVTALGFGTFLCIAFVGCLALLFIVTSMPEARGRTHTDLEEEFQTNYSTA